MNERTALKKYSNNKKIMNTTDYQATLQLRRKILKDIIQAIPEHISLIRNHLENKKNSIFKKSKLHKKCERRYRLIYYSMGVTAALFSVVVSSITGTLALGNTDDVSDEVIYLTFIMSLMVSVTNVILNFFEIEDKISKHHVTSQQYNELYLDMDTTLLKPDMSYDDYEDLENLILEKLKYIGAYAPDLYNYCSCLCCCNSESDMVPIYNKNNLMAVHSASFTTYSPNVEIQVE